MTTCFYHKSDLDGHCSGAIVKYQYPDCKMIGVGYEDSLDRSLFAENNEIPEHVFVVDFCFSRADMIWLEENTILVWLDHHKSSIESIGETKIHGRRKIGTAGCELTWEYLFLDRITPLGVTALGRYDVWDHYNKEVVFFQYGMRAYKNTYPDNQDLWKLVFNALDDTMYFNIVERGIVILDYETIQNKKYAAAMAYETTFEDLRAIAINKPFSNSLVFNSVYDPDKHDIMILVSAKLPGKYSYSIYSNKSEIDVSEIAKKYGGGGHKGAAGFMSDKRLV